MKLLAACLICIVVSNVTPGTHSASTSQVDSVEHPASASDPAMKESSLLKYERCPSIISRGKNTVLVSCDSIFKMRYVNCQKMPFVRTKRDSYLALCIYCCKCCQKKGCGYCCHT